MIGRSKLVGCCIFVMGLAWMCSTGMAQEIKDQDEKKQSDTYSLEDIVVSASPTDTSVEKMAVRAQVITEEEIERLPARTVMDLLQYVEGVFMPLGEGTKQSFPNLTIRGLGSGYFGRNTPVIFMLNGHNLTGTWGSYFTFADLQLIPARVVERIEVIKGPYSSIYGSGALGGVINIVTKKRFSRLPEGTIEGTVGSEDHRDVQGYLAGRYKNFNAIGWGESFQGDSRKYYSKDWESIWGYQEEGVAEMQKFGGSVLWDLPNSGFVHFLAAHEDRNKNLIEGRVYGDEHFDTDIFQLYGESPAGDLGKLKIYLNYGDSKDWELGDFGNGISAPKNPSDPHYITGTSLYGPSKVLGAKTLMNIDLWGHMLTPGVEYRRQETGYDTWIGDKEILAGSHDGTQDIYSAFLEANLMFGKLEIIPSVRFDYFSTEADYSSAETIQVPWDPTGGGMPDNRVTVHPNTIHGEDDDYSIDPKLLMAYYLNPNVKLRAAAGRTFRAPTALERYNYDYGTVQQYAASGELDPERVTSVEAGSDLSFFDGRLNLAGTVFYLWADDRIEFAPSLSDLNTKVYQNLDSEAYGLELSIDAVLYKGLRLSVATALTHSEYTSGAFEGLNVPSVPDFSIYPALDYTYKGFSAHLGLNIVGNRDIVNDPSVKGFAPVTVDDDPYYLLDASVRYDYKLTKDLTAFVKLWGKNLLDDAYTVDTFFVYLEPYALPNFNPKSQGATVFLSVGLDF